MFNLDAALELWKTRLATETICQPDDIIEMEDHLHDEMDALSKVGLSAEESFLLATKRLGSCDSIHEEFNKVNTRTVWKTRVFWMVIGLLGWKTGLSLLRLLNMGTPLILLKMGLPKLWVGISTLAVLMVCVAGVFLLFRRGISDTAIRRMTELMKRRKMQWLVFALLLVVPRLISFGAVYGTKLYHQQSSFPQSDMHWILMFSASIYACITVPISIYMAYFVARYLRKKSNAVLG